MNISTQLNFSLVITMVHLLGDTNDNNYFKETSSQRSDCIHHTDVASILFKTYA